MYRESASNVQNSVCLRPILYTFEADSVHLRPILYTFEADSIENGQIL